MQYMSAENRVADHLPQIDLGVAGGGSASCLQARGMQTGEGLPRGQLVGEAVAELDLRLVVVRGQAMAATATP
jgi:hypothetical protein